MKKTFFFLMVFLFITIRCGLHYGYSEESTFTAPTEGLGKKISLDLRAIDVLDLFKFIAQKGNLNIVLDSEIGGKVALFLKDVTIKEVIDIAAASANLGYVIDGGIVRVMTEEKYQSLYGTKFNDKRTMKSMRLKHARPQDVITLLEKIKSTVGNVVIDQGTKTVILMDTPDKVNEMRSAILKIDLPVEKKTFVINYADASYVLEKITDQLSPEIGMAKLDERTNRIIIKDYPAVLENVGDIIKSFDVKDKQVLIDAKIVEISLSDDTSMGINWDSLMPKTNGLDYIGSFPAVGIPDTTFQSLSIGKLANDNFSFAMKFLQSLGNAKLISSPRLTVLNNQKAAIHVGTTEHYFESQVNSTNAGNTTASAPQFIDVGVKFTVTPKINDNDFISMLIEPEVSSVKDIPADNVPIIQKSVVKTKVLVHDGVTILIAGLIKDDKDETVAKTPFLGDLPFVGVFFRSTRNTKEKREVVVFITPHIVTGEENIFAAEDVQKKRKPRKDIIEGEKIRKGRKTLNDGA